MRGTSPAVAPISEGRSVDHLLHDQPLFSTTTCASGKSRWCDGGHQTNVIANRDSSKCTKRSFEMLVVSAGSAFLLHVWPASGMS
jgi:hypothetical protein